MSYSKEAIDVIIAQSAITIRLIPIARFKWKSKYVQHLRCVIIWKELHMLQLYRPIQVQFMKLEISNFNCKLTIIIVA